MKLLRCLIGAYAGQLIEYPEHVAENLLMTGHAEEPGEDEAAEFYGAEKAILPKVETAEKPKRKRVKK